MQAPDMKGLSSIAGTLVVLACFGLFQLIQSIIWLVEHIKIVE